MLAKDVIQQDPTSGVLFGFTNARRNKLKLLVWREKRLHRLIQGAGEEQVPLARVSDESVVARLAAREERIGLLEGENRWLMSQLFGHASETTPIEERSPDQAWLF